jgi:hypothetical protein
VLALPDTQPLRGGAPLARAHRGPGLGSAALRLLNRYSFGFALLLSIALLIANLVEESGSFSVTNQLADLHRSHSPGWQARRRSSAAAADSISRSHR